MSTHSQKRIRGVLWGLDPSPGSMGVRGGFYHLVSKQLVSKSAESKHELIFFKKHLFSPADLFLQNLGNRAKNSINSKISDF